MKRTMLLLLAISFSSGILFSQSLNFKIGLFAPALQSDLWQENINNLAFNRSDMLDTYYAAEYEFFFNRIAAFSVEIGKYRKEIYSEYRDYTFQDDSPILQNMSLSVTPIEANIKLYPFGHRKVLLPFLGVGIGLYAWTYQQWGDFVIFPDMDIQEGFAETSTFSFGLNARAGLILRFHHRLGFSLEGKYQYARGQLSGSFEGFELFDLGGLTCTAGIHIYLR